LARLWHVGRAANRVSSKQDVFASDQNSKYVPSVWHPGPKTYSVVAGYGRPWTASAIILAICILVSGIMTMNSTDIFFEDLDLRSKPDVFLEVRTRAQPKPFGNVIRQNRAQVLPKHVQTAVFSAWRLPDSWFRDHAPSGLKDPTLSHGGRNRCFRTMRVP